jgi:phosphate transport system substrate-binding protein
MESSGRFHSPFSRFALILAALVLLGSFLACSAQGPAKPKPQVPPGGMFLQGAGATFPSPLYKKWFAAYHQAHPQIVIAYDSVGSGEGMRRFIGRDVTDEDQVDFGASDAALRDDQIAQVAGGVVMLPVTAGGVVLAYNLPGITQDLKLSRRAYAGIFLGEIKTWNDPLITATNPGVKLPPLTIVTVVRQDASGTTFAFSKHLDAISEKWRRQYGSSTLIDWPGNAMRAKGNEGVAGLLSHSVGGLGYVGFEFAHRYGLQTALLENKMGNFIKPSGESFLATLALAWTPQNLNLYVPDPAGLTAYPIATFTWILLRKNYEDAHKSQALRNLFSWSLDDGQQYAASLGYVPLPSEVIQKAQIALQSVKP